jgi:L-threonylcarbamoyladenylate synthase
VTVEPRQALPLTIEGAAALERCMAGGGVALFPSDTVYGLATTPTSEEGIRRIYELKRRPREMPSALMFFAVEAVLVALPELGPWTREALTRVLPGPLMLVLPNPSQRYPLAGGPRPDRIGVRVPALDGALAPLREVRHPVLQSSANLHGGPDPRRVEDVSVEIRAGVDLALDGGELPGVASTIVDLSDYERDGRYTVLREGALPAAELARLL